MTDRELAKKQFEEGGRLLGKYMVNGSNYYVSHILGQDIYYKSVVEYSKEKGVRNYLILRDLTDGTRYEQKGTEPTKVGVVNDTVTT